MRRSIIIVGRASPWVLYLTWSGRPGKAKSKGKQWKWEEEWACVKGPRRLNMRSSQYGWVIECRRKCLQGKTAKGSWPTPPGPPVYLCPTSWGEGNTLRFNKEANRRVGVCFDKISLKKYLFCQKNLRIKFLKLCLSWVSAVGLTPWLRVLVRVQRKARIHLKVTNFNQLSSHYVCILSPYSGKHISISKI